MTVSFLQRSAFFVLSMASGLAGPDSLPQATIGFILLSSSGQPPFPCRACPHTPPGDPISRSFASDRAPHFFFSSRSTCSRCCQDKPPEFSFLQGLFQQPNAVLPVFRKDRPGGFSVFACHEVSLMVKLGRHRRGVFPPILLNPSPMPPLEKIRSNYTPLIFLYSEPLLKLSRNSDVRIVWFFLDFILSPLGRFLFCRRPFLAMGVHDPLLPIRCQSKVDVLTVFII